MRRILKIVGVVVGAFILLAIILSIVDPAKKSTVGNTGTTATTIEVSATTVPATTTAPAPTTTEAPTTTLPALVTVQNQTGSGISSLPEFTIPAEATGWYLGWSYNCGSFGSGNFIVDVNGLDGTETSDSGVNELNVSGNGVEDYYDTGTFQLDVNSECNWAVKVTYSN